MKMEKRALIAFVASILLFLAYDAIYLSPKVEKQRAKRAQEAELLRQLAGDSLRAASPLSESTGDTELSKRPTAEIESASSTTMDTTRAAARRDAVAGLPVAGEGAEAKVTVTSALYEITLSSVGAEIASAKLLQFTTQDQPVELIPQTPDRMIPRAMNVSLDGQATSTPLAGVSFEVLQDGVTPLLDGTRVSLGERRAEVEIVFRVSDGKSRTIERYYRFFADRYDFETGVRFSASAYPTVTTVTWGMGQGLRVTEANVKDDQQNFKASIKLGEDIHRLKPSHFGNKDHEEFSGTLTWAALQTKYFMAALIPAEPSRGAVVVSGDKGTQQITQQMTLPAVPRGDRVDHAIKVYMGPLDYKILKAYEVKLEENIEMGWRWIRPVAWVVLWSMTWTHNFIPNYGLIIILISILTKVLFYRLTHKSFKSMKDLQDLQPRMQAIKEKYKDDRQRQSQETMKLYKEAGVNPLGGCLPMLLQMPVFIALFNVLKYTIEVRGAHFVWWINDLSQQDVLFKLPFSLPLIGNDFSLLPILMGASMLLQTKIGGSITPGSPNPVTPKGFQTMLPIVFTFLFYSMPSGLVLYWIVNTVLSVAQQYYIHKDSKPKDGAEDKPANSQKRRLKTKGR